MSSRADLRGLYGRAVEHCLVGRAQRRAAAPPPVVHVPDVGWTPVPPGLMAEAWVLSGIVCTLVHADQCVGLGPLVYADQYHTRTEPSPVQSLSVDCVTDGGPGRRAWVELKLAIDRPLALALDEARAVASRKK